MSNVHEVRPSPMLKIFNNQNLDRDFSCTITDGDIGSTSMLEKLVLVTSGRVVSAKSVFEFGTYKGETTQVFIKNHIGSQIVSIDLPYYDKGISKDDYNLLVDVENDDYLTKTRSSSVDDVLHSVASREGVSLQLIKMDSRVLDVSDFGGLFDLIFIDGGHTTELIKNDTLKALKMLAPGGIIFWHDYKSDVHSDVTDYINELSKEIDIFHVGDTSLAFHTDNDYFLNELLN